MWEKKDGSPSNGRQDDKPYLGQSVATVPAACLVVDCSILFVFMDSLDYNFPEDKALWLVTFRNLTHLTRNKKIFHLIQVI